MENNIYEVVYSKPEDLSANYINRTCFNPIEDKDGYKTIRNIYIEYSYGDVLKDCYKPSVKGVYCIEMDINANNTLYEFKDIYRYKSALKELLEYVMSFRPKIIALPIIDFSTKLTKHEMYDMDDSIKLTFDLTVRNVWEMMDYSPEKIIFYTEDTQINLDNVQKKIDSWVKNYILSDYEKEQLPAFVKENQKKEDIRITLLDKYIEKNSKDGFDRFIAAYLKITEKKASKLYNAAQISKQDYSKMITGNSLPKTLEKQKYDTISLLLCCKLPLSYFKKALASRGFALSPCSVKDLIIQYFILEEIYDINLINVELVKRNLPVLGNSLED